MDLAERIPPDLWKLHWQLANNPKRREIALALMDGLKQNLEWFPRYQVYLRDHRPPTLIVWGPQDGFWRRYRIWWRICPPGPKHETSRTD